MRPITLLSLNVSFLDPTFRSMAESDELNQILYQKAFANQGNHKGALAIMPWAATNRNQLLTKEDWDRLNYVGQASVFANDNRIVDIMDKIPGKDIIFPFRRAPTNVVSKMIGRSPVLGAALHLGRLAYLSRKYAGEASKLEFIQRQTARELGWQGGSVITALAGWWQYKQGNITLNYPTDPDERKDWEETGKIPFALNIGGKYISARFLYPATFPLFAGALMDRSFSEAGEDGDNAFLAVALAGIENVKLSIEDIPSMQFMEQAMDFLFNPHKEGNDEAKDGYDVIFEWFANTATGAIPYSSLINNLAKATTPNKPELFYEDYMAMVKSKFFSRIPGLRGMLPPEFGDLSGEVVPRNAGSGPLGGLIAFFLGGNLSTERNVENDYINNLRELYETKDKFGRDYAVSPANKTAGDYPGLKETQVKELNREVTIKTAGEFQKIMDAPQWASLDAEGRQKALKNARKAVADAVWGPYEEHKKYYDPDNPPKAQKPSKQQRAYGQGVTSGYFSELDMTPTDWIQYRREQIENGELDLGDRLKAEEDIVKYQIQALWHERGAKQTYELYHNHGNKRILLKQFVLMGQAKSQRLLHQMATYELQLHAAGIGGSRTFTKEDGTMKSWQQIFGKAYEQITGESQGKTSNLLAILKSLFSHTSRSRVRLSSPKPKA